MDTVLIVVHTLTLALTVVDSGYVKMRLLNAVTGSITLSLIDMQFLSSFSLLKKYTYLHQESKC